MVIPSRSRFAPAVLPLLLALLAVVHGLLYVWLVPPWQAPDEPTQFEYAALLSRLGRVPTVADRDPALDEQIVASMLRERFFVYLLGRTPDPPPRTLDDARALFFMPRQVGGDPPLYFALAALPIRLLPARSIEEQLLVLRLLGVLWLAGTVLCAYAAAWEALRDRAFAVAVGLCVALQPMAVFIAVAAGNDGLANLLGAALCYWLLRALHRPEARVRSVLLLAVLLLLGVMTKRSLFSTALLLALIGGGWALWRLFRAPLPLALRAGIGGGALMALLLAGVLLVAGGRDVDSAADWYGAAERGARRVLAAPGTGRPALEFPPGQAALQALPDVAAEWTQNHEVRFSARVWAASGTARGRLKLDFGWAAVEIPFTATASPQLVEVRAFVPLYGPYLHAVVYADEGTIYADDLRAGSARRPALNLLTNGDLALPGWHPAAPAVRLAGYLRLRELGWAWRSGQLMQPPPLGWDLPRIFFVSFWGQFGWMSLPLVGGTPWEGALLLLCVGGTLGVLLYVLQPGRASLRRGTVVLLALLVLGGLLFPLLNAYTQPRAQVIQQGRYLFPALVPVALLLALGWRLLLPSRWRAAALVVWALFWLAFAGAALHLIVRAY